MHWENNTKSFYSNVPLLLKIFGNGIRQLIVTDTRPVYYKQNSLKSIFSMCSCVIKSVQNSNNFIYFQLNLILNKNLKSFFDLVSSIER